MVEDCVFCKIASGEVGISKIYENESFFSIPDISPVIKGHSLIVCKKHFKNTLDLPNTLGTELLECIKETALKIINREKAEGFNIINNNFGAGGQKINHIHYHLIPRKKGDNLKMIV